VKPDLLFAAPNSDCSSPLTGKPLDAAARRHAADAGARPELQRRENDVVMATFGNGFWILDDYSPLREVSAQTLAEDVRLFPLRHVYQFQPWGVANAGAAGVATLGGNYTTRNPPNGAVFTFHVREALPEGTDLVLTIRNTQGNQVRQVTLTKLRLEGRRVGSAGRSARAATGRCPAGSRRAGWRRCSAGSRRAGWCRCPAGSRRAGGATAFARAAGAAAAVRRWLRAGIQPTRPEKGDTVTHVGPVQSFQVRTLPQQNYILYR